MISKDAYEVYLIADLPKNYKLWNRLNDSTGSVMDNKAEGFGRDGNKEFVKFLSISKSSYSELKVQFYKCIGRDYIDQQNS
jgi:four helix bundle protein